jgi:hypothetical protein
MTNIYQILFSRCLLQVIIIHLSMGGGVIFMKILDEKFTTYYNSYYFQCLC